MHRHTAISSELAELGRRLREFREAHVPRPRLPEELWSVAAAVARQEGLYRTARTLHLDYATLKRRVKMAPASASRNSRSTALRNRSNASRNSRTETIKRRSAPAAFVELLSGAIAADCLIELEGAGGGRLRLRRKLTAAEVMSLVRDWQAGTSERDGDGPA